MNWKEGAEERHITQIIRPYLASSPRHWSDEFCGTVIRTANNYRLFPLSVHVTIEPFDFEEVRSWETWDWDEFDELRTIEFSALMRQRKMLPPTIWVDNCLEDGFHRLHAAHRLGMTTAPRLNWESNSMLLKRDDTCLHLTLASLQKLTPDGSS
jgi:hypothetical protein